MPDDIVFCKNGGCTAKLGVGILCAANRVGEASEEAMAEAIRSMTTLNKYAAEAAGPDCTIT